MDIVKMYKGENKLPMADIKMKVRTGLFKKEDQEFTVVKTQPLNLYYDLCSWVYLKSGKSLGYDANKVLTTNWMLEQGEGCPTMEKYMNKYELWTS